MRILITRISVIFLLAISFDSAAQVTGDFRSLATGFWSAPATWQRYSSLGAWENSGVGENNPGQVPGVGVAGGNVTILNTHTVTCDITNATAILSLTVGSGASGIFQFETANNRTLTITNNLSILTGAQMNVQNAGAQNGSIVVGGNVSNIGTINLFQSATRYADLTINGTTISGNGTYTSLRNLIINGTVTNSSTSTINLFGDLTCNNTFTCSAGTFNFRAGAVQNINGGTNPIFNNVSISINSTNLTLGGTQTGITVNGNFTMLNNSIFTFGTIARTVTIAGNLVTPQTITMQGALLAHQLRLGGAANATPATAFNTTAGSGSTVEYFAAGPQSVFTSLNYRNLKFSGSGTKTFGGATTVNNDFDITGAGVTISVANALVLQNLNISGSGTTTWGGNSNTTTITGNVLITNNTTFIIGSTAGQVKTISVSGNVQIDAGSSINNGGVASVNLLTIFGNLQVDGVFNMVNSFPANVCNVTFSGATSNTITGTGATCNFNQITLTKGAIANVLDVQRVITMSSPTVAGTYLTLTSGTFKLSSATTITPYFGNATICAGIGKLWVNNAIANISCVGTAVNANPGAPTVTGTLQITAGTFEYGSGNDVMLLNAATSNLTIDGGTLNMYGGIAFSSTSQFNMSSGSFNIDPQSFNNLATGSPILSFASTSAVNAVTFSNGTLTIVDPHNATGGTALVLTAGVGYAYNFAGSTIQFGNGISNSNGANPDGFSINAGGLYALGNISLNNGTSLGTNRFARLITTDCIINTGLLIGSNVNDDLRLNGRRLTLNGTLTVGAGTITGTVTSTLSIGGNNTPIMNLPPIGGGNLLSLIINKTGTNNEVNLGGSLALAAGGVLTLTSGILELGNFNLTLNNSTNGAIAGAVNSASNMVSTNGSGYLILNANKTLPFVFPIGSGNPTRYYSPLTITAIGASTAGTVSARAVSTSLGTTYINKYWDVLSSVARTTVTATFQYDAAEANVAATTVAYSPGNPSNGSSMQTPPSTGSTSLGTNAFTVTGTAPFNGWWTLGARSTFYSYQTGLWNTASTWTSDPSGTLQIGSSIPGFNDNVVILSGRTVTLTSDITTQNLDITIQGGGFIDMSIYQFTNGLLALRDQGTLQLSSINFPIVGTNTFVNAGGGTVTYQNAADFTLPIAQATYNNLTINAPGIVATQLNNLTLNGNLYISQGTFQINDNSTARRQLLINGNVTVDATGSLTVGLGVTNTTTNPALPIVTTVAGPFIDYYDAQTHRVVIYGDFTNNGVVRFTNLPNPVYNLFPPIISDLTTGIATVYFRGATNNFLTCNNTTDFYNLVVDKGSDQTNVLTVYSIANNTFRLFGANTAVSDILMGATASNPNLKKALWIRNGTLTLTGLTAIPSLTEGTAASAEYYISANAALVLDGSSVAVLSSADDYNEVNVMYSVSGGSGLVNGVSVNGFNALIVYGKLQVNDGYLSTRESGGIVTNSTASGQVIINGGVVDAKQFSAINGAASYQQTGGTLLLRGRFQRTPVAYTLISDLTDITALSLNTARSVNGVISTVGTFNLENTSNVFNMSGGNILIYDVTDNINQEAFDVKSSGSNINVTNGTIEIVPTTGSILPDATNYLISSNASLGNFIVNRASGTAVVQLNTGYPLTILKDFSLTAGDFTAISPTATSLDLTVGEDFNIQSSTTYTTGTNTTTLNGTGTQTFTINLAAPLSLNKFTINKPSNAIVNLSGSQQTINVNDNFNLTLGTLNDNGATINVYKNVYNSGLHNGSGKISLLGAATTQTIDGNGTFQNLELNNTNAAAAPISLINNTTINGTLIFSQDKLFNINTYNLRLNSAASIINSGVLRYIQCAGNAGDGGVTKVYSSTAAFNFPVGASSTSHVGVPNYTPGSIGFGVAPTTFGSITVVPVGYAHPNETTAGRSLSYFWRVRSSGFTLGAATVTHGYTYSVNDVITGAGITENGYVAARFDQSTSSWSKGTTSDLDIVAKIIGQPTAGSFLNNISFIDGDYTAGDDTPTDPFGVPLKFYSIANGRWNANTTWSYTSGGVAVPAGAVPGVNFPGANSIVYVESNFTVKLNSAPATPNFGTNVINTDVQNCASLTIKSGSTLDIGYNPGCNFALLVSSPGGNGTIRIATAFNSGSTFANPSGDFSDFNVNLGTTELYSSNAGAGTTYWLKNGVTTYGNLIISPLGGSNIIFPNNDVTIYGNCTTNGQNADSWFLPTWNVAYPTAPNAVIAKTITIRGDLIITGGSFGFYGNGALAQTIIVNGNVTVALGAGIDDWGGAVGNTESFSIGGNFINNTNGITNAPASTVSRCNFSNIPVTFFGSTNASISNTAGNPTTTFSSVTVNKGNSQATTLTIDIAGTLNTPTNNWLNLQNGTLKYMRTNPNAGAHFAISTTTNFTIPSTAGLYVNMPSNINNVNILIANSAASDAYDLILNGKLTVVNGNVYVGPVAGGNANNDIEYSGGGSSAIEVQGGNLIVNGQIRRPTSTTNGILNFTLSGGNVTINGNTSGGGAALALTRAKLEVVNAGSQFNLSSGTLNIIRGGGTTFGDLYLRPGSAVATGGTIVFSNVAPNSVQNYLLDANTPLYNLTVTGAAGFNATLGLRLNPLVLNGSLTLTNARSIFNSNNFNVTIKGDLNNTGTYNYGTNTTTFSGGVQNITGTTISNFYNLTVSPVTSLTVNNNFTVNNNLSLSGGTLTLNSFLLTLRGSLTNNANYSDDNLTGGISLSGLTQQQIYGAGNYSRLVLNNINGAKSNNDITLQGDLVMTQGVLDINQYLLMLTQTSIISGAGFSITKMIKSDGVASNAGTRKFFNSIAAPTTFTFPVGVAGKYTPAVYNITNSSTVGYIGVNPVNSYQPTVLDPSNVLNYYWAIESSGISNFSGTLTLQYLSADVNGTENTYVAARLILPSGVWSKAAVGPGTDNVDEALHTATFNHTGENSLSGDYTAGDDPAIPSDVPTFETISDGDWTDNSIWVPVTPTVIPCPIGGPNGFNVIIHHNVVTNVNNCSAYNTTITSTGKLKIVSPTYGHNLGNVDGTGILYLENGNLPAGNFSLFFDCTFGGGLEYGGTGTYTIIATLFNSIPKILISGTGTRVLPNKDLTICNQLKIDGSVILDNSVNNKKLFILGTMERYNGGGFKSGTGVAPASTVTFSGATVQSLGGPLGDFTSANGFNNLEINNSLGLNIGTNGTIEVKNNLILTNGLINTTATNKLTLNSTWSTAAIPTGGTITSFVNGPLIKFIPNGSFFLFPIGNGNVKSHDFTVTSGSTKSWTAEYFPVNSNPNSLVLPLLVSNTTESWNLSNNSVAATNAKVKIAWDAQSDLTAAMTVSGASNSLADMRVGEYNGTAWTEVGTAGTLVTSGTITIGDVTSNTNVNISTTPKLFTTCAISNTVSKAAFSPTGIVCGTSGIPISFTLCSTPLTLNYTLNYTVNGIAQPSATVSSLPYTLPTPIAGAYQLTGFTYNGNTVIGRVDPTIVNVYANPNPSTAGTDQSLCGLSGTTLVGNNPAPYAGSWSIISGVGGITVSPTAFNSVFTGISGRTYNLVWTNNNNGCVTRDTVIISYPLLPVTPSAFTSAPTPVCQSSSGNIYTVPNVVGNTYTWTYSGTGATITGTTNSVSVAFNSTATSGTISVTTSNSCGTSSARSRAIVVTPLPVATFSYTGSPYCSNAANPSPTFSGGGVAGTFSSTAGLVFVSAATGVINISASTPGTYTVTNSIAAAGGCGIVTANSSVTIHKIGTWVGGLNSDWFDANNWVCTTVPSQFIDATIPGGALFMPIISASGAECKGLIINTGASLTLSGSNNLDVWGDWINDNTFISNNGTIYFKDTTTISGTANTNFNNITIASTGNVTAPTGNLNVEGDWINNGLFNASTGTVTFINNNVVHIAGDSLTSFNNLTLNKSSNSVILNNNTSIGGLLTMTNGNIVIDSCTLILDTNSTTSGGSDTSYIQADSTGFVKKMYNTTGASAINIPIGDIDDYSPFTFKLNGTSTLAPGAFVRLNVIDSIHPNLGSPSCYITRYWHLDPYGITTPDYDITFTYTAADVVGSEASIIPYKYSTVTTPNWNNATEYGVGGIDLFNNTLSWSGVTSFSHITGKVSPAVPLPIELLNFNAKQNENKVDLNWTTASEKNNDYFTVERSQNAVNFYKLIDVKGAGNSNTTLNYSTSDPTPLEGISYYRLKQTDYDGKLSYSNNVVVDYAKSIKFSFDVSPNPNEGLLINLTITAEKGEEVMFVLSDMYGKDTYKQYFIVENKGNNIYSIIPSPRLISGTYILTATTNQKTVSKMLIVK